MNKELVILWKEKSELEARINFVQSFLAGNWYNAIMYAFNCNHIYLDVVYAGGTQMYISYNAHTGLVLYEGSDDAIELRQLTTRRFESFKDNCRVFDKMDANERKNFKDNLPLNLHLVEKSLFEFSINSYSDLQPLIKS